MRAAKQQEVGRGSQKWLRQLVNDSGTTLSGAITAASHGAIRGPIKWRSPLRAQGYAEYRDQAFLDCIGAPLDKRPLASFWPTRGPRWDALGRAADGAPILVEAKSHASETESVCKATAGTSLDRIRESLAELQRYLAADLSHDWTKHYYQYANRLAHLYLLRELNGIPAWLVFLYFVGDEEMQGPNRPADWTPVRRAIHDALGLPNDVLPHVIDAYFDVRTLTEVVGHAPRVGPR